MPELDKCNEAQKMAVTWEGGPLLVLAGPGSGKTFTIVQRIFYLLDSGIPPEEILVITFTRDAAFSMQRRFREKSNGFLPVSFGTFHSVFYTILRESHVLSNLKLITGSEKIREMTAAMKQYRSAADTVAYENLREDAVTLLSANSYYKNTCLKQEALFKVPVQWQESFFKICDAYERNVKRHGYLDFDDMLFLCRKLLAENTAVREKWQNRFSHILIDEFQDINPVQYEIVKLLSKPPYHIFAVGDDDQSIYGFRGSKPELLKKFQEEFGVETMLLDVNYRSLRNIIDASLAVMEEGKNRFKKELKTGRSESRAGVVSMQAFQGKEEEQSYLAQRLDMLLAEKTTATKAVFFRTNSAMQSFALYLRRKHIPYRMREQSRSVYEHFIVQDIMAYLLLAEQYGKETDMELLLRILNKPCRYINREDADRALKDEKLTGQLTAMHGMKLPLAITYILKAVGYEKYLRQLSLGKPEKRLEWEELLEWLREDAANYNTASEWLALQRAYGEELNVERNNRRKGAEEAERDSEADAVQLMTVHASKGLEFDHVFIPDCNEGGFPHGRMPEAETVEEERRVFYVAMTRAKESLELLYLTGTKNSPRLPSRFLNPLLDHSSSSSISSSNSQSSRYSSNASTTFSYSSSSAM